MTQIDDKTLAEQVAVFRQMKDGMLSIGIKNPDHAEIEIHATRNGIKALVAQLGFLIEDKTEHLHLMSEDWGGSDLTDGPLNPKHLPVKHVTIYLRSDDAQAERQGCRT